MERVYWFREGGEYVAKVYDTTKQDLVEIDRLPASTESGGTGSVRATAETAADAIDTLILDQLEHFDV